MWKAESMLTQLLQLDSLKNFVEVTPIVSTIWNVPYDIFHNVKSAIRIFHIVEITM